MTAAPYVPAHGWDGSLGAIWIPLMIGGGLLASAVSALLGNKYLDVKKAEASGRISETQAQSECQRILSQALEARALGQITAEELAVLARACRKGNTPEIPQSWKAIAIGVATAVIATILLKVVR